MRLGPLTVEVFTPGVGGVAPLKVLRRRPYLRVVPLPRGRALAVGWLRL